MNLCFDNLPRQILWISNTLSKSKKNPFLDFLDDMEIGPFLRLNTWALQTIDFVFLEFLKKSISCQKYYHWIKISENPVTVSSSREVSLVPGSASPNFILTLLKRAQSSDMLWHLWAIFGWTPSFCQDFGWFLLGLWLMILKGGFVFLLSIFSSFLTMKEKVQFQVLWNL